MLFATSTLALFGFAYSLVPVVSVEVLNAGATGIGAILAGGAAGGLVGPVLLLALRGRVSSLTALVVGAMTMSVGMVAFAFSPSLAVAVAAFAVIGATGPVGKAVSDGYMQLAVDSAYRGRVGSLTQVSRGFEGLSAFLAGGIAQVVGVESALVFAAVITGTIAIWLLLSFKRYGVDVTGHKLAQRAAGLLGTTASEQKWTYDQAKGFYDVRSRIEQWKAPPSLDILDRELEAWCNLACLKLPSLHYRQEPLREAGGL